VITNLIGTNSDGSPRYANYTNGTSGGVTYYGTVHITNAPVSPEYADKMRLLDERERAAKSPDANTNYREWIARLHL
jgi:hypothetical protein